MNAQERVKIGFVHNAFPVLSETFISKEMRGLAALGLDLEIYSLFRPAQARLDVTFPSLHGIAYLLDPFRPFQMLWSHFYFLFHNPKRYMSTFRFAARSRQNRSGIVKTIVSFVTRRMDKEQRQDMLLHFMLAALLARWMKRDGVTFVNSHFADAAASFALLSARLLGVEFGITAHAYDIFAPQFNLTEKLKQARFILTCTQFNKKSLVTNFPNIEHKVHVFYHGIDAEKFNRQSSPENTVPIILAVGRLTRKKGFEYLLRACAILQKKRISFRCTLIGDGEEEERLTLLANELGLVDSIEFVGAVPPDEIVRYYAQADVFALPSIIDEDGNRDGIPNVIAEAMAMQLPVVSTTISGIPELVVHEKTGVLIAPKEEAALANALASLLADKERRQQLGKAARDRVLRVFDSRVCLESLYTFYMNELSNGDLAS